MFRRPDDITFTVPPMETGEDDEQPYEGDVVTFSYKDFTQYGVPVDPQLIRVRNDLDWQDTLQNYVQSLPLNGILFTLVQPIFNLL